MSLKNAVAGLKRLSLHELDRDKENMSVWVLNRTKDVTGSAGAINLTVADGMGGQIQVRVPVANIPVDLSTQATRQNLISSPQVRTLHAKKVIEFIDPEQARTLLASNADARAENQRLYKLGEVAEVGNSAEINDELQQVEAENAGDLNPFAITMAFEEAMTDEDILMTLRGREDELGEKDFLYLVNNSKHERVKSWAAEKANALKAE